MRTLASPRSSSSLSSPPTPGACTSTARKSCSGIACAMAAVVSPMPKPISRIRGALRPKTRSKSSSAGAKGMPKRGNKVSRARCCAGENRPWRSTKLRMGRRRGPAPGSVIACGARSGRSASARPSPPSSRRSRCIRAPASPRLSIWPWHRPNRSRSIRAPCASSPA